MRNKNDALNIEQGILPTQPQPPRASDDIGEAFGGLMLVICFLGSLVTMLT